MPSLHGYGEHVFFSPSKLIFFYFLAYLLLSVLFLTHSPVAWEFRTNICVDILAMQGGLNQITFFVRVSFFLDDCCILYEFCNYSC